MTDTPTCPTCGSDKREVMLYRCATREVAMGAHDAWHDTADTPTPLPADVKAALDWLGQREVQYCWCYDEGAIICDRHHRLATLRTHIATLTAEWSDATHQAEMLTHELSEANTEVERLRGENDTVMGALIECSSECERGIDNPSACSTCAVNAAGYYPTCPMRLNDPDPRLTAADALAEADDPEPPRQTVWGGVYPHGDQVFSVVGGGESPEHAAWRNRQALRTAYLATKGETR